MRPNRSATVNLNKRDIVIAAAAAGKTQSEKRIEEKSYFLDRMLTLLASVVTATPIRKRKMQSPRFCCGQQLQIIHKLSQQR